jgi:Ca2+-binding RTX toxin-like protein
VLAEGAGNDRLIAGTGRDRLTGGAGADTFEFGRADGTNRITDFDTARETIRITGGARRFEGLTIAEDGADAVVRFGRTEVLLLGVDAAMLDAAVFDFV